MANIESSCRSCNVSLCSINHLDFNNRFSNSYESVFNVMRKLNIEQTEQMYRRVIFNIIARNQDDHTKNIAFMMNRAGKWSLAPAYDLTWAYNPGGGWAEVHQMSVNGKRTDFFLSDLLGLAHQFDIPHPKDIIQQVSQAVSRFPDYLDSELDPAIVSRITNAFQLKFD